MFEQLEKDNTEVNHPVEIFDDYEAKENIVGLFNLLLQIDKRNNPEDYQVNYQNND